MDPHDLDDLRASVRRCHAVDTTAADFETFLADRYDGTSSGAEHLSAIAWVFDRSDRRILLVDHPLLGWSCPGGHVEEGETPLGAARRELAEETTVAATPRSDEPFMITRTRGCGRDRSDEVVHWTVGYAFEAPEVAPVPEGGVHDAAWFRIDALPSPRTPDIDRVLAAMGG